MKTHMRLVKLSKGLKNIYLMVFFSPINIIKTMILPLACKGDIILNKKFN